MPRPTIHRFWRSAELPGVESRCANDSRACYAPHAHAALSIGAVDGGSSILQREGERRRMLRGDVVVIPAGEVHCCNPHDDGRWSYQMLYLDEAWLRGVGAELAERPPETIAVAARIPQALAPRLHARLTQVNALLFSAAPTPDKEAALVLLAGELFECLGTGAVPARPSPAAPAGALQRVQALIRERCGETLRLDELAACAGMSRYRLLRAFRDAYGMTPHAWQLDLRIQRARRLLERGMSFADAALSLGFADQSHFQRAFKQRVAATPGEYLSPPPAAPQFSSRR